MRNYLSDGAVVTRTAPVGGVTSGVPLVIGSEFLVPQSTAAAGALVACVKQGKVRLTAASGDVWTEGAKVFYNPTSGECEAEDADDNYLIGTAEGPQAGGTVDVVLNGVSLAAADGDLDAKADKTVPTAAGNIAILTAGGNLADSETALDDLALSSDIPSADGTTIQDTEGVWSVIGGTGGGDVSSAIEDPRTDGDLLAWDSDGNVISTGTPATSVLTNVEPGDIADFGERIAIPQLILELVQAGVGGNPDTLTLIGAGEGPYPFIITRIEWAWTAGNAQGRTVELRDAVADGNLIATLDAEDTGGVALVVVPLDTTQVGVGLFAIRSDDAIAGQIQISVLKGVVPEEGE